MSRIFTRTYDSMGRVRTLAYPDNEVVTYTYNGFGDVEKISGLKNSVTTDYVKDVSYNASGQITFLKQYTGVRRRRRGQVNNTASFLRHRFLKNKLTTN